MWRPQQGRCHKTPPHVEDTTKPGASSAKGTKLPRLGHKEPGGDVALSSGLWLKSPSERWTAGSAGCRGVHPCTSSTRAGHSLSRHPAPLPPPPLRGAEAQTCTSARGGPHAQPAGAAAKVGKGREPPLLPLQQLGLCSCRPPLPQLPGLLASIPAQRPWQRCCSQTWHPRSHPRQWSLVVTSLCAWKREDSGLPACPPARGCICAPSRACQPAALEHVASTLRSASAPPPPSVPWKRLERQPPPPPLPSRLACPPQIRPFHLPQPWQGAPWGPSLGPSLCERLLWCAPTGGCLAPPPAKRLCMARTGC